MNKFKYQSAGIYYQKEGSGTAVVLLHGFAENSDVWKYQVAFLKEQYMMIVPDLPGSGQSDTLTPPTESAGILMQDYADCIYALLQHENIEKCIMLGHSMGGYITLAFAEKYPGCLLGFGLVHSTAFADTRRKKSHPY